MRLSDFDYELPREAIAQAPLAERDQSRLLVAHRGSGGSGGAAGFASDCAAGRSSAGNAGGSSDSGVRPSASVDMDARKYLFRDLPALLQPGDLVVVNDARVVPARLRAWRATGGELELLLLGPVDGQAAIWRALVRPARRVRTGEHIDLESGLTPGAARMETGSPAANRETVEVISEEAGGVRQLRFRGGLDVRAFLDQVADMPLPPYISPEATAARRELDRERYQTVYARTEGAVAAPTAGLHVSERVLESLAVRDIAVVSLTLHVGPGTFRPVTEEFVDDHRMDPEEYEIPESTVAAIHETRQSGGRIVAVGTTVVRALEHSAVVSGDGTGPLAGPASAHLFIRPGFRFRVVDAMITNFHLPRSTPLLMVGALMGVEQLRQAYQLAIQSGYRFYSYGDAMLILP